MIAETTNHDCTCDKPLQKYSSTGIEYHNWNCPQTNATGLVCHNHFGNKSMKWEKDECTDCQKANQENADRIQRTETIDPNQPYGQHIALTCKNHPDRKWSTKNISHIGARSIFYFSDDKPECNCPMSDLIIMDGKK